MKTRAVKSISFKLVDPYEIELFEHANQFSNFSIYVKRLIQRDMEKEEQQSFAQPYNRISEEDKAVMEGFF